MQNSKKIRSSGLKSRKPKAWKKKDWRSLTAAQQPSWPDQERCADAVRTLSQLPALVFAGETRSLRKQLREVAEGRAYVLQAGDCSENFSSCHGPYIHDLLKVILRMSAVLSYAGEKKIITIGRFAGQYAKPRSADVETVNGRQIPSYRGDMVNDQKPDITSRTPDPNRMVEGYFRAAATLNLVRAFTKGGYAALNLIDSWSEASFGKFTDNPGYEKICFGIQKAVKFMQAIGIDASAPQLNEIELFTSHEALLLEYEEAMTRIDTTTGRWYDTSTHMPWIGERTRQPDGAHVQFLSGVCNPVGVKIGPDYNIEEIKRVIQKLNPHNEKGRLTLITRFGAEKIGKCLPPLLQEMKRDGLNIVWICDPMHGNTYVNTQGQKTRSFESILEEVRAFWSIHNEAGTFAGGIHLELSGRNVTECIGGAGALIDSDLDANYQSSCDPRLNAEQSVELAFEIARMINP